MRVLASFDYAVFEKSVFRDVGLSFVGFTWKEVPNQSFPAVVKQHFTHVLCEGFRDE